MKYSLFKIFAKPSYFILAASSALFIFSFIKLSTNIYFLKNIILSDSISFFSALKIAANLIFDSEIHINAVSNALSAAVSVLAGINVSLFVFYIKLRKASIGVKNGAPGIFGFLSGIMGIGCIPCGSIFFTSFLPLFSMGWIVALLPFRGAEFSILSIILLAWSIKVILQNINTPTVCPVKFDENKN